MLSRRKLLSTSSLGAVMVLTLGGSSCSIFNQTAAQIQSDVQTIAAGIAGIVTAAQGLVPANILTQVQNIVTSIKADAADIGTFVSGISTNSILIDISNGVAALSSLLGPFFPQAPVIAGIVQAAVALIQFVLNAAGITTPTPAAASLKATMTADQARQILQQAAANGAK